MLRLHGLDIRWGGPSRSGSEPSSPPTADAALGSEIEVASARLADTSSAGSVVASADEGTIEGRWKKWWLSLGAVAATPISSRYRRIGSGFP